jgi:hypothetical protein
MPERESDVLRASMAVLRERLPNSWTLKTQRRALTTDDRRVDQIADLTSPDGQSITLLVEAKRLITPRDVQPILDQLAASRDGRQQHPALPVLVARYLPESARQRIARAGAGYIDVTGNVRISADRPGLLLVDRGADSDPWRGPGRPRAGLRGEPAARVVRALVDFAPPYSVPELAERAGSSTGATYRVIEFLQEEELLVRQARGPITDVRWRQLLMRWSEDYGLTSNPVSLFIEPRGLGVFLKQLGAADNLKYALTGSLAAQHLAPFAPPRQAVVYADDPAELVTATGVRRTQTGGNVLLVTPRYDVVFERAQINGGVRVVAPSQTVVDLLTGPGRNPSESTALLDWMERNEPAWRD